MSVIHKGIWPVECHLCEQAIKRCLYNVNGGQGVFQYLSNFKPISREKYIKQAGPFN